jgi:hypothetical protein
MNDLLEQLIKDNEEEFDDLFQPASDEELGRRLELMDVDQLRQYIWQGFIAKSGPVKLARFMNSPLSGRWFHETAYTVLVDFIIGKLAKIEDKNHINCSLSAILQVNSR